MKYLSAYALAWLSGKANPTVKDLESIISSVGGDFDKERADAVIESLTERDLAQVVRSGIPRLQSCGASVVSSSVSGPVTSTPAETKKEEKKEEKDEEADMEGALNMFGDDDDY